MKTLKTASYEIKIAGKIEQVVKLVQKGISVATAIEQIFGIGNDNPQIANQVKKLLNNQNPPKGKFQIRSI